MTYKPPYEITGKILNLVGDISEIVAKLEIYESKRKSPYLRKINKIKTITGTLEIEGNTLGEKKITAILEGKPVIGSRMEIAEVKGAIKAYDNLDNFDYTDIDDLLLAHKMFTSEILVKAGSFRNQNVGVGNKDKIIHIAPPSENVSNLMNNLFEWVKNSDEHPLIKSSVFHYEFEFIHPFIDGNGRLGRFWQTLILYKWKKIFKDLPIESIIRENQDKYYEALKISGQIGKSTPFIEFMLESILNVCKQSIDNLKNVPENDLKNVPEKRLKVICNLMKKNRNIKIAELAEYFGLSDKTIKRDIGKLKEQGKIKRIGSAKSGYWEIINE